MRMSPSSDVLRLYSSCLLSKWGFQDGDEPEIVYDYCEAHGIDYTRLDWHATLVKLVRTYLLPALDQKVEVYEVETIHNPIRAETVDGSKAWSEADIDALVVLTSEYVDVPMDQVAQAFEWEDK